jgi:two-component system LytT family sensor kinase
MESALISTENAYLKSQINPHFLFNSLNFIYNSVNKFSVSIADTVMSLSEIMRYALLGTDSDGKVALSAEVEHVENFIKLNQARFNQRLCVHFSVSGEITNQKIIPLSLITLVENVFKYGDLTNSESPAKIILTLDEAGLSFITENRKRKRNNEISHGIGLQNLKRRLQLHHRFEMAVHEDDNFYRSELRLLY